MSLSEILRRLLSDDSDAPATVESAAVTSSRATTEITDAAGYAVGVQEAVQRGARKRANARVGAGDPGAGAV
jgi:hypothetical protein